jgi:hypothetical protein
LKRHATSSNEEVSIPDEVTGYFLNLPNSSSRTMSLGSTQYLTEIVPHLILLFSNCSYHTLIPPSTFDLV